MTDSQIVELLIDHVGQKKSNTPRDIVFDGLWLGTHSNRHPFDRNELVARLEAHVTARIKERLTK